MKTKWLGKKKSKLQKSVAYKVLLYIKETRRKEGREGVGRGREGGQESFQF